MSDATSDEMNTVVPAVELADNEFQTETGCVVSVFTVSDEKSMLQPGTYVRYRMADPRDERMAELRLQDNERLAFIHLLTAAGE